MYSEAFGCNFPSPEVILKDVIFIIIKAEIFPVDKDVSTHHVWSGCTSSSWLIKYQDVNIAFLVLACGL